MDQDDKQVVGIPRDADLERIRTRRQIDWLAARRNERAARFAEHCNRGVNVCDAQLDSCGARILDRCKFRLAFDTLEVDQRELQARRWHLQLADTVLPTAQSQRIQDSRIATVLSQWGEFVKPERIAIKF